MNADAIILGTALLVSTACALLGTFLVLRRLSLLADAVSHAVLPGIVAGFWLSGGGRATLPALLGAAALGLITVTLVEALTRSGRVKGDAAIGLVFPALFSVGVLAVSVYFRNVHLDLDAVLYGEIAYAPFNDLMVAGRNLGPVSLWVMGALTAVNLAFVTVMYKELKLSTFDAGLAAALGFAPGALHYALMALVSVTTVGAFDAVGAILVVAFMIVPAATASLLSRRLPIVLALAVLAGWTASIVGYVLAILLDASIAGAIATILGVQFLLAVLLSPHGGVLTRTRNRAASA
ncbi:metal ABC transporter permease [Deinococcus pimensis]|uniref:metal ABC transporter permease n=1 Tax=Deinococcus pimensis TaxID=309888 RepID=UPI0004B112E4|nr:metal ABC transporter permease [Deinococcus pimensis]